MSERVKYRVYGTFKPPGERLRRLTRTVEARTAFEALTAYKRMVPHPLRPHWIMVEARRQDDQRRLGLTAGDLDQYLEEPEVRETLDAAEASKGDEETIPHEEVLRMLKGKLGEQ